MSLESGPRLGGVCRGIAGIGCPLFVAGRSDIQSTVHRRGLERCRGGEKGVRRVVLRLLSIGNCWGNFVCAVPNVVATSKAIAGAATARY